VCIRRVRFVQRVNSAVRIAPACLKVCLDPKNRQLADLRFPVRVFILSLTLPKSTPRWLQAPMEQAPRDVRSFVPQQWPDRSSLRWPEDRAGSICSDSSCASESISGR